MSKDKLSGFLDKLKSGSEKNSEKENTEPTMSAEDVFDASENQNVNNESSSYASDVIDSQAIDVTPNGEESILDHVDTEKKVKTSFQPMFKKYGMVGIIVIMVIFVLVGRDTIVGDGNEAFVDDEYVENPVANQSTQNELSPDIFGDLTPSVDQTSSANNDNSSPVVEVPVVVESTNEYLAEQALLDQADPLPEDAPLTSSLDTSEFVISGFDATNESANSAITASTGVKNNTATDNIAASNKGIESGIPTDLLVDSVSGGGAQTNNTLSNGEDDMLSVTTDNTEQSNNELTESVKRIEVKVDEALMLIKEHNKKGMKKTVRKSSPPKITLINISQTSLACAECSPVALINYKGKEHQLGHGDTFLKHRVAIVNDSFNLVTKTNNVRYSYRIE